MIISKEILETNAKQNNIEWLKLTSTQNRLKLYIKSNKGIEEDVVRYIWGDYEYRPQLVKFQKLPPDLISEALARQDVKGYISTATYINLVTYQSLTDEQILEISDVERKLHSEVWKAISPRVFEVRNNDTAYIISLVERHYAFPEEIITGVVRLLESKKLSIINFLEELFSKGKYYERFIDNLLLAVSKKFLIADNVIDEIISQIETHTEDELLVSRFSEYLIARDNCSINMKAKLLLKNI
jgi:hypothetical protein